MNCIYPIYTDGEHKLPPGNYIRILYTRIGICKCRRKRPIPRRNGPAAVAICHQGYIPSNSNPLFPAGAGGGLHFPGSVRQPSPCPVRLQISSSAFLKPNAFTYTFSNLFPFGKTFGALSYFQPLQRYGSGVIFSFLFIFSFYSTLKALISQCFLR